MKNASLLRNSQKSWEHPLNRRSPLARPQFSKQAQQTSTPNLCKHSHPCNSNSNSTKPRKIPLSLHSNHCLPNPTSQFKPIKHRIISNSSPEEVLINSITETVSTKVTKVNPCTASNLLASHNTCSKAAWVTSSKTVSTNSSTTKTLPYTSSRDRSTITNLLRCSSQCRCSSLPLSRTCAWWARTWRNSNHRTEVDQKAQIGCIRLVFVLSSTP
jgi:hypothetical protein